MKYIKKFERVCRYTNIEEMIEPLEVEFEREDFEANLSMFSEVNSVAGDAILSEQTYKDDSEIGKLISKYIMYDNLIHTRDSIEIYELIKVKNMITTGVEKINQIIIDRFNSKYNTNLFISGVYYSRINSDGGPCVYLYFKNSIIRSKEKYLKKFEASRYANIEETLEPLEVKFEREDFEATMSMPYNRECILSEQSYNEDNEIGKLIAEYRLLEKLIPNSSNTDITELAELNKLIKDKIEKCNQLVLDRFNKKYDTNLFVSGVYTYNEHGFTINVYFKNHSLKFNSILPNFIKKESKINESKYSFDELKDILEMEYEREDFDTDINPNNDNNQWEDFHIYQNNFRDSFGKATMHKVRKANDAVVERIKQKYGIQFNIERVTKIDLSQTIFVGLKCYEIKK